MFEVNKIDLSKAEFEELKLLIAREDDVVAFANSRLQNKETNFFNEDIVAIHRKLNTKGLVEGYPVMGGFVFTGLTLAGRSFIDEYNEQQKELKRKTRADRTFQIGLSILTFILSIIASIITSFLVSRLLP